MAWWDIAFGDAGTPWSPPDRYDYSVGLPVGTPVESPVNGIVLPDNGGGLSGLYSAFGQKPWGGEVDILSSLPSYPGRGGLAVVDVIHFDTLNVQPGDVVTQGSVIGTSGGQRSGGHWPSEPRYSTGPHIGVGVRSYSGFTPAWNPLTLLRNLLSGTPQSYVPTAQQLQQAGLSNVPINNVTESYRTSDASASTSPYAGKLVGTFGGLPVNVSFNLFSGLDKFFHWFADPLNIFKLLAGFGLLALGILAVIWPEAEKAAGTVSTFTTPAAALGTLSEQRGRRQQVLSTAQAQARGIQTSPATGIAAQPATAQGGQPGSLKPRPRYQGGAMQPAKPMRAPVTRPLNKLEQTQVQRAPVTRPLPSVAAAQAQQQAAQAPSPRQQARQANQAIRGNQQRLNLITRLSRGIGRRENQIGPGTP